MSVQSPGPGGGGWQSNTYRLCQSYFTGFKVNCWQSIDSDDSVRSFFVSCLSSIAIPNSCMSFLTVFKIQFWNHSLCNRKVCKTSTRIPIYLHPNSLIVNIWQHFFCCSHIHSLSVHICMYVYMFMVYHTCTNIHIWYTFFSLNHLG